MDSNNIIKSQKTILIMRKLLFKVFRKIFYPIVFEAVKNYYDVEKLNISGELQKRALSKTADYVEQRLSNTKTFNNKFDLIDYSLNELSIIDGLILEFGVWKGSTINYIAKKVQRCIYGFDSFDGLPEFWRHGYDKGAFKMDSLPKVANNVVLIKGLFRDSLPKFLEKEKNKTAFIHIDCDLYSSTKDVLNLLKDRISVGTIIIFDEYFNYYGWENGEYKAFEEYCIENNVRYEYIGYCELNQQVSIRIIQQ